MTGIAGQRVAIIGGTSGIGLALGKAVSKVGGTPVVGSRDEARCRLAAREIGPPVEVFPVDATRSDSLREFFRSAGNIDHLAVSISGGTIGSFRDIPESAARMQFDRQFWPAYAAARESLERIRPDGSLVFITGALSRRAMAGRSAITASQMALEGLARALAVELAPLRVNVLVPGLADTGLWSFLSPTAKAELFARSKAEQLLGFVPNADPAASAALELLSNCYITGTALVVDGGWSVPH